MSAKKAATKKSELNDELEEGVSPEEAKKKAEEDKERLTLEKEDLVKRLIETEEGHAWCEDLIWSAIKSEVDKLGW